MPLLHAAENFPSKPDPKAILVNGPTFERLVYVWEFFNNFGDYFNIPSFKLEELHASLTFGSDSQPLFPHEKKASEEEEQDWEEFITNKTVAE